MTLHDLDEVLYIERASFTTPWSRRAFITELTENHYALYLVARRGDRVVGYAGMWIILDEAHITNIAVHPACRGQGVGTLLMQAVVERTTARGCRKVTLEVRRSNLVAQHLYERFGFRFQGVRKGYYTDTGEDAFVMVRENGVGSGGGSSPTMRG